MLLKSFADSGSTRYSSVVCANRNPHPNVKGINPQEKRKQERKERWVRGPHSLGAGRQRRAGVTGFREWEGVQQGSCLPGEVETEARRLAVVGSALEGWVVGDRSEAGAGNRAMESKFAERIMKATALTSLLAAGRTPYMGEAESKGPRSGGSPDTVGGGPEVKVYILNGGTPSCLPHSDSRQDRQTHYIRERVML